MVDDDKKHLLDEYYTIWIMLAQTKNTVLKARQKEYSQYKINDERRRVLWCVLNNDGKVTPVELARQLLLELHSVTMMLNRMEKEGLVERGENNSRSRSVIKITPKGLEVFNQSRNNEMDQRIFSALSRKEQEQFMSSLRKIRNQALKELGIPAWRIKFPLESDSLDGRATEKSN